MTLTVAGGLVGGRGGGGDAEAFAHSGEDERLHRQPLSGGGGADPRPQRIGGSEGADPEGGVGFGASCSRHELA